VLNTYLIYLRFEVMRGKLTSTSYNEALKKLKAYLQQEDKAHFNEFLEKGLRIED
jgi:site-specific recombinase XerC